MSGGDVGPSIYKQAALRPTRKFGNNRPRLNIYACTAMNQVNVLVKQLDRTLEPIEKAILRELASAHHRQRIV